MELPIKLLHQAISDAKHDEQQTGSMAHQIQIDLANLLNSISITSSSPIKSLIDFIEDYIETAPEHLEALHQLSKELKLNPFVQPFLDMCSAYFIKPPEIISSLKGLESLFNQAYMTHRVLEELNDKVMNLSGGVPLAPMDMSMANIISHTLIGDERANQLDHLVLLTMETTSIDTDIFEKKNVKEQLEKHRLTDWSQVNSRWPSFTKDCSIHLNI